MKKVIKLLKNALGFLEIDGFSRSTQHDMVVMAAGQIAAAITKLKAPRWETPEEFKDRTGQPWKDDSAVYMWVDGDEWRIRTYRDAKFEAGCCRTDNVPYKIYCANSDVGIPGKE